MADQPLDLVVFHENRELTTVRVIADVDDPAMIREHLLAVMKTERDDYEPQIANYSVDVHKAGYGMKEYTYRSIPGGK